LTVGCRDAGASDFLDEKGPKPQCQKIVNRADPSCDTLGRGGRGNVDRPPYDRKTLREKQPAYYRLGELFGVQKEA
jgi:hypothetical protein